MGFAAPAQMLWRQRTQVLAPLRQRLAHGPLARHLRAARGAAAKVRLDRGAIGVDRLAVDVGREEKLDFAAISHSRCARSTRMRRAPTRWRATESTDREASGGPAKSATSRSQSERRESWQ